MIPLIWRGQSQLRSSSLLWDRQKDKQIKDKSIVYSILSHSHFQSTAKSRLSRSRHHSHMTKHDQYKTDDKILDSQHELKSDEFHSKINKLFMIIKALFFFFFPSSSDRWHSGTLRWRFGTKLLVWFGAFFFKKVFILIHKTFLVGLFREPHDGVKSVANPLLQALCPPGISL